MKKLIIFLYYAVVAALFLIFTATFIKPENFPFINISSVILPYVALLAFFYSLSIIFIFRNYKSIQAIATILFCFYVLSDYILLFGKNEQPTENQSIKILSYNVSFFSVPTVFKKDYYTRDKNNTVFNLRNKVIDLDSDIILLQEFFNDEKSSFYNNIQRFDSAGFNHFLKSSPRHHNGTDRGIVTFSKFPIINSGIVCTSTNTYNGAIFTDLIINSGDTLRVINAHLTSMAFYAGKRDLKNLIKFFYHSYSKASQERARQIDSIKQNIKGSPYPVILAGDFNETPFSYVYRQINNLLNNSFEENGNGFGFTYYFNISYLAVRIDHMFFSNEIENEYFNTLEQWDLSEHKPIFGQFYLSNHFQ